MYKKEIIIGSLISIVILVISLILFMNFSTNREEIKILNTEINSLKTQIESQDYSREINQIKNLKLEKEKLKLEFKNQPNELKETEIEKLISQLNYLAQDIKIKDLNFQKNNNFKLNLELSGGINGLYTYLNSIKQLGFAFKCNNFIYSEDNLKLELEFLMNKGLVNQEQINEKSNISDRR